MEIAQNEFEKYLRNISYFLTFRWLIITFAVILWLVKYKDLKSHSKLKIENRNDFVYVNI